MVPRLSALFGRAAFALALMLMVTATVQAQSPIRAHVYEFGTYASEGGVEIGTTRQGIVRSQTSGIRQLEPTRKVLGKLGVEFGFRYKLTGVRPGALVPLTIIAKFPPPGVLARDSQKPIMQDDYADVTTAGKEDFLTWTFEMRSDLVPGIWTFEIWSGKQKLAEENFEVILPPTS
jgi:hypothetical protein